MSEPNRSRRSWSLEQVPWWGKALLITVSYALVGCLGRRLGPWSGMASPIWLASGVALAALLLCGARYAPAVSLGALIMLFGDTIPAPLKLLLALGDGIEPLVATLLLQQIFRFRLQFDRPRDGLALFLCGGLVGPPISAAIGVVAMNFYGLLPDGDLGVAFMSWVSSNCLGNLIVVALVLIGWNARPMSLSPPRLWERVAMLASAAVLAALVFATPFQWLPIKRFPVLPSLLSIGWSSVRFGRRWTMGVTLGQVVVAIGATAFGAGPFAAEEPLTRAFVLQSYLLVISLTAILISAYEAQRRRAVEALAERHRLLSESEKIAGLGSFEWDSDDRTLSFSTGLHRILGTAPGAEQQPHSLMRLIHPEESERVIGAIEASIKRGERVEIESRVLRTDGAVRHLVTRIETMSDADRRRRAVGVVRDVTPEREAVAELRRREQMFRDMTENLDLIFWFSQIYPERNVYLNSAVERLWGLSRQQLALDPDHWMTWIHPEDRETVLEQRRVWIESRERPLVTFRTRVLLPSGEVRQILAHAVKLVDENGRTLRSCGVVRDITAALQAEDESRRLEMKLVESQRLESLGVLAGGIAHDFNNLLTTIMGSSSLARQESSAGEQVGPYLEQIDHAASRAAALCQQMLAYAGRGVATFSDLSLTSLALEMEPLLRSALGKNTTLTIDVDPTLSRVRADEAQIKQLLLTLVTNAAEAIGEESGRIELSAGRCVVDSALFSRCMGSTDFPLGPSARLQVTDSGCGIPRELLHRVYDPFFSTKFAGRGLGLAAALGIVQAHRGLIHAESRVGSGTTLSIYLPLSQIVTQLPGTIEPVAMKGVALVIDDEPTVREIAGKLLGLLGIEAVLAPHGRAGLQLFAAAPDRFSVVLLDVAMPELGGEETCRGLRLIRPDVKILLMSGFSLDEASEKFAGLELSGFLQKPFGAAALRAALAQVRAA